MAHLKLPTRLLVLTLALCLLCPTSVARGRSFGVARRTLLQGEGVDGAPSPDDVPDPADDSSDPPVGAGDASEDVYTPGPTSDNSDDMPDEDGEDGPEDMPNGGDDESGDNEPMDDPAGAVDETPPEFEDTPPEDTNSPPVANNAAESTPTDETSPNTDATDSTKKSDGPSGVAVAFSVIGAVAFVAVVAGGVFFVIRQRDTRGLEFKPLREMELSNDAGEKGELRESNPETYNDTKLQRSDSYAYN